MFTAAAKKTTKTTKAPKVTVASLSKELTAANSTIQELTAVKVSLTAKTAALEADLKKLKKEKDSMLIPLGISALIALTLAGFLIAGIIGKQAHIAAARKKAASGGSAAAHFEDIETHVLDDWHNIFYHPEKVNRDLYDDLNNHFPELYLKIEKWKADIGKRGIFTGHLISLLATKFPDIEGTDSLYLLALDDSEPFVDEYEIAAGAAVCARMKRELEGNSKMMKAFFDEVHKQFQGEFGEVKDITNEIASLKDEIDVDIRKIKHHRKIEGVCKYMNV